MQRNDTPAGREPKEPAYYAASQMVAAAVGAAHERLEAQREVFERRATLTDAEWWDEVKETGEWWQQ